MLANTELNGLGMTFLLLSVVTVTALLVCCYRALLAPSRRDQS